MDGQYNPVLNEINKIVLDIMNKNNVSNTNILMFVFSEESLLLVSSVDVTPQNFWIENKNVITAHNHNEPAIMLQGMTQVRVKSPQP